MRKKRKHKIFSIEEKNNIVRQYLNGETGGMNKTARTYDVSNSVIANWIKQYHTFGTCVDRRGLGTKKDIPSKGRPKSKFDYESMTKKELIDHIRMLEDIKKTMAYLEKQKKNIKS